MLAQRSPDFAFFSLAHHIDIQWLEEAYHSGAVEGTLFEIAWSLLLLRHHRQQ
jgi:hypothetical protein